MIEMFESTHWYVVYNYLAGGHPPLILQLLVINTIFFVWFIIKRMRGQIVAKNRHASFHVQELLIFSNALILMQDQYLPFLQHRVMPIVDKVQRML